MLLQAYLNFNGNCAEAFKFYEDLFGGKIVMMTTHGESPMSENVPPDWKDAILHVRLEVGDQVLMGSDAPPNYYQKPQGMAVSIGVTDPQDADRIFEGLAENGTVQMPIQQTFWAIRFGMVTDRFGIPWMVNCEQAA